MISELVYVEALLSRHDYIAEYTQKIYKTSPKVNRPTGNTDKEALLGIVGETGSLKRRVSKQKAI